MRALGKLSALKVQKLLKKVGRHADGGGLYLHVVRAGAGFWQFRYRPAGHALSSTGASRLTRYLGLGPVHSVSLAEARNRARQARQCLLDGGDPLTIKHEHAQARRLEELRTITFAEACDRLLATDRIQKLKDQSGWRHTLKLASAELGKLPLQEIDSALVLKVLLPIWKRTPETGIRLRGRMEEVFDWAKPLGLFTGENPARLEPLRPHLPAKATAKHHAAMAYADLPAFMVELRGRDSVSARALELTILTGVRTSETIKARWSEFDLEAGGVWTIPAERMKAKKEHRVPLSERAVELLREVSAAPPKVAEHVFINGGGKPLSNMAMLALLKGMGANCTTHGFRSTFMDWAHERTSYPKHVIDQALAHTIGDKVEAAYRRGDLFEKRARLMSEWARYLEAPVGDAENVVSLRA